MAGFATKSAHDYEKEYSLDEWSSNTGNGLMGLGYDDLPDACFQFCLEQFHRFRVPMNDKLAEVIQIGGGLSVYYLDVFAPYALLSDISDVNITDDWANVTYQIYNQYRGSSYEPEPEHVESFVFVPGQSEAFFQEHMARPGLKALPGYMGETIEDLIEGEYYGEPCQEQLSPEAKAELDRACAVKQGAGMVVDKVRQDAYFGLAAWATFLWLAGPPGRTLRAYHHEIMSTAISEGECILVDGMVISPKHYNKLDRPPKSCNKCGVQTWCVENTMVLQHTAYVCEKCLNFDLPPSKFTNCGAKFCTFSACPNHPYHAYGRQGAMRSYRENGQLNAVVRGETIVQVMGQHPNLKRLGI